MVKSERNTILDLRSHKLRNACLLWQALDCLGEVGTRFPRWGASEVGNQHGTPWPSVRAIATFAMRSQSRSQSVGGCSLGRTTAEAELADTSEGPLHKGNPETFIRKALRPRVCREHFSYLVAITSPWNPTKSTMICTIIPNKERDPSNR